MRAFGLVAPADGLSLPLHDPHPARARPRLERGRDRARPRRGLPRRRPRAATRRSCSRSGVALEGHADNLAACLAGGVCLTWDGRIARIADTLAGCPDRRRPGDEVATAAARAALARDASRTRTRRSPPAAPRCSAPRSRPGDADLFAAALADRLHEPYRAASAPLLDELRAEPPAGSARHDDLRLRPDA